MADAKSAKPPEEDYDLFWQVIGLIIFLLVLGTILDRTGFSERLDNFNNENENQIVQNESSGSSSNNFIKSGKFGIIGALFPSGEIATGDKILNKGEVIVRANPGGTILGKQINRAKGNVLAGPVEAFQKKWLRIDYKDAPDGWVSSGSVTKHVGWFTALNIIPITFGILKPFFLFMTILIIVLIIVVLLKMSDLKKENKRRENYKEEHERNSIKSKLAKTDGGNDDSNVSGTGFDAGGNAGSTIPGNLPGAIEIENLPTGNDAPKTQNVKQRRWANVQSQINSHSVNDWKQAILEADIILEEMLEKMGYKGDSIGEKLKKVERSDFITLDKAWEAHKVRNRVAHKGSDFVLSRDEAEKAIDLYKEVFEEFYYV
jgi:hypothetical protein